MNIDKIFDQYNKFRNVFSNSASPIEDPNLYDAITMAISECTEAMNKFFMNPEDIDCFNEALNSIAGYNVASVINMMPYEIGERVSMYIRFLYQMFMEYKNEKFKY